MVEKAINDFEEKERENQNALTSGQEDRKKNYSPEQLEKYFQFKETMKEKLGEEMVSKFSDNIYCRYLTGYVWDIQECEKNMAGMAVRNYSKILEVDCTGAILPAKTYGCGIQETFGPKIHHESWVRSFRQANLLLLHSKISALPNRS